MQEAQWTTALAELRAMGEEAGEMCAVAAAKTGDEEVARQLHHFRAQHAEHVARIDDLFFGQEAGPEHLPEELTARLGDLERRVSGAAGEEQALLALLDAELLQAQYYEQARHMPLPEAAAAFVRDGLAEEQTHLDWLQPRARIMGGQTPPPSCEMPASPS